MTDIEESKIITALIPLKYRQYDNETEINNLFNYIYKDTFLCKKCDFENSFVIINRRGESIGMFEITIRDYHPCEYDVYKEEMIDLVKKFEDAEKAYLMFKDFKKIEQAGLEDKDV